MADTILIIDTNTLELRKLREILTKEGYGVMTATDLQTARQICEQIDVKFVLGQTELITLSKKI